MRRLISLLVVIALTAVLCVTAHAEDQPISMQFIPCSQRGTLYYLDIYSDTEVAAAMFELRSEPAAAYRSVYCDDDNAAVEAAAEDAAVKIVYSNRSAGKGKLFRVAFKAQSSDSIRFTLRTVQAADAGLQYLTDIPDVSAEICPYADSTKGDDASSGSKSSSKTSSTEKSSKKSYSGKSSGKASDLDYVSDDDDPDDSGNDYPVMRDLSDSHSTSYFLLGAAAVILAALLIVFGVVLGKRLSKKREKQDTDNSDIE